MRYFKKELVSNRLALPNGRQVHFEPIANSDTGLISTEDESLIAELEKAIAARRGGVSEVSESIFTELKKNPPAGRSRIRSLNAQSVRTLMDMKSGVGQGQGQGQPRAAANETSAPMEVPKALGTVSKKRLTELASQAAAAGA